MIGFVIVSHSARLAEGVCELAAQMAQGRVRLAAAGGTDDPSQPIGTDAFRIRQAIEQVWDPDGVLVFTDLGSAVLSAEMALEMLDAERRARVRLCEGPLVEGAVAAVSLAAAGAPLEEAAQWDQWGRSPTGPGAQGRSGTGPTKAGGEEVLVTVSRPHGLHARPAAELVKLARRFQAEVSIENITGGSAPVPAGGMQGLLAMGARQGHQLHIRASGPEAAEALAEIAAFLAAGEKELTVAEPASAPVQDGGALRGIPASAGIAIGPLVRLHPPAVLDAARQADDPAAEEAHLSAALAAAARETRDLYQWAREHAGASEAAIFDAQALLLEDPALVEAAGRFIREERATAAFAWQSVTGEFEGRMRALDDPYLRARAADVADVAGRVARALAGEGAAPPVLNEPAILAAHDLTPSEVKRLDPALALGIALETGGAGAHAVILARAMGIPVVAGLGPGISAAQEGTTVALDGERGLAWISPGPEQVRALEMRRRAWVAGRAGAQATRHRPAVTRDGRAVRVFANVNSVEGAREALDCGAEGIGVLRTEFLFLGRATAPDEDEQYEAYRAIAETLGQRPLVIRTLDIGGDKGVPYIEIGHEANPFLGWRGIRVSLGRRDLLRTQLRAIVRAGAGHRVEVLFPMISSVLELREAKAVLREVERELGSESLPAGAMIEVPAAVAIADLIAREAAFFSIGTNDLAQYTMAADRTNARVAPLADAFDPAVLRLVRQAAIAAHAASIGATLCGELAADPLATTLLIGLGIEEFSASAPLLPELKRAIANVSARDAGALADRALALDSAADVRRLLSQER